VTPRPTLEDQRRETLALLEAQLGSRAIGENEYRRRAEVARRGRDETELAAVRPPQTSPISRISPSSPSSRLAPAAPQRPAPAPPGSKRSTPHSPDSPDDETGFVVACLGGSLRNGTWEPPATLYSLAFMGGVELDFREAALLEGRTDVVVLALMGGVKITVPDDIDVEVNGFGFMGGFEHISRHSPDAGRPLLRIRGGAIMGGVSVKVKPARGSSPAKRLAERVRKLV